MSNASNVYTATLGGGCFWCLEAVFKELRGVVDVVSGYAGGARPNPTYQQVCSGATGHAEVVQISFDPAVISFPELLQVFFSIHDPTQLNRQGHDVGTQYRSVIYWHDQEQQAAAQAMIAQLDSEQLFSAPLVTEVAAVPDFFPAEAYHQDYFQNNSGQPYCQAVVSPKVAKLRKHFAGKLKQAAS